MCVWDMSSFGSFCLFVFNLTLKFAYEAVFVFFSAFADAFTLCLPKDRLCLFARVMQMNTGVGGNVGSAWLCRKDDWKG